MNLLIFLTHSEPTRSGYEKYLGPRHPELSIKTCGTRDEALKHTGWADIVMCFGPQARQDFFRDTPRLKWVHSLGTGTDGITDGPPTITTRVSPPGATPWAASSRRQTSSDRSIGGAHSRSSVLRDGGRRWSACICSSAYRPGPCA